MRKIENAEEIEKRRQRNARIISIILLFILLISSAGFAFLSSERENKKNKENIQNINGRWIINYRGTDMLVKNSFDDVKNISVDPQIGLYDFSNRVIYIDSEKESVSYEISSTIGKFASRMQEGCYGKCDKNLPELDCNSTLIVYREASENSVRKSDKCIFIEGDIRAVDALIYRVFQQ